MPAASTTVDREAAKGLYMQGIGATEIARRLGCSAKLIQTWAYRKGWGKAKVAISQETKTTKANLTNSIEAISKRTRQVLAEEVERQASVVLAKKVATSWETLTRRGNVVQTIARTAATVFGWDQEQTTSIVRVGLLSQSPSLAEQIALSALPVQQDSPIPAQPALPAIPDQQGEQVRTDKHA